WTPLHKSSALTHQYNVLNVLYLFPSRFRKTRKRFSKIEVEHHERKDGNDMKDTTKRIRDKRLVDRVVSAEEAASWITDGMTLGLSGFTRAGDVKATPMALIRRAQHETFKINVFTGASLGSDIDQLMSDSDMIHKRLPFQADKTMRHHINAGDHLFVDQHLSHTAELLRQNAIEGIDYAILEAVSITDDGYLIPTTSIGNSLAFAESADHIIIEINMAQPESLEG